MAANVKRNYKGFLNKFRKDIHAAAKAASISAGELITDYLRDRILNDPKTGKWYPLPGSPGVMYQASAAYEYPAFKTGDLWSSVTYQINKDDIKQGKISLTVIVDRSMWTHDHQDPDYDEILYDEMERLWIPTAINDLRPQIDAMFRSKALILHEYTITDSGGESEE